jgi:Flp pilus assembly protein TadG
MSRRNVIKRGLRDNRGQNLLEFAAITIVTLAVLFAVVEFGRMILVYTTIASAARIGVRYAMVTGTDNLATTTQITAVVNDYLSAAPIVTGSGAGHASVNITYPGYTPLACASGAKDPGCPVQVTVSYAYQPMLTYFPINVTLSSQSQGVITF